MRWVILADDWPPQIGGVATWGFGAAAGLAARGHTVRVFCRHRPGLFGPAGTEVVGVRGRSFGRRGAWWTSIRASLELARADAVLATTWPIATVAAPWLHRRGIPLHVVFHGSDATRTPADPAGLRAVVAGAHRCWAVSHYLTGVLADRGIEAAWIPSPIDPRPTAFDREGPWALAARATELKGGDRFVRLVAAAGATGRVVGDGPALGTWRQLASQIGARVEFLGPLDRDATLDALNGCALIALLSRPDVDGSGAEGLGLTLLEGAAAGLLSVGSATGGIPEAAALVLPRPDDAVASAAQVRTALAHWDPEPRATLVGHGTGSVARALAGC